MRRQRLAPSAQLVASAGVPPEDLLYGDDAARVAGFDGAGPSRALAAARRRGRISGWVDPANPTGPVWFRRADLESFRAARIPPDPRAGSMPWMEVAPTPGGPVSRVEHELELEVARLRERLKAVSAERDRLREVVKALASAAVAAAGEGGTSTGAEGGHGTV